MMDQVAFRSLFDPGRPYLCDLSRSILIQGHVQLDLGHLLLRPCRGAAQQKAQACH